MYLKTCVCILHIASFVCSSTEKVSVKCNQTGKVFKVKVASLSRVDDGNMSADDLAEGSQLLMNMNRKEIPSDSTERQTNAQRGSQRSAT